MMRNLASTAADQARQHAENLRKGVGFADVEGLNLEREGTVLSLTCGRYIIFVHECWL